MKLLDFLSALLSKLYGADAKTVASYINEDGTLTDKALNEIIALDLARIDKINISHKEDLQATEKKIKAEAKAAILDKSEADFKEAMGFKSDAKGLDLYKAWAESITKKGVKELTEEQIKQSKTYLDLVQKMDTDLKAKDTAFQAEKANWEKENQQRDFLSSVREQVGKMIDEEIKPVYTSTDPAKIKKQRDRLIDEIMAENDWRADGEGDEKKLIPVYPKTAGEKAGKDKTDEHLKRLEALSVVKGHVETIYDLQAADSKDAPPPPGGGGNNGGKKQYLTLGIKAPASQDDYATGISKIRSSNLSDADKTKATLEFDDDWQITKKGQGRK